jgi:calcium-translocating P-type ATPase
MMSAPEPVVGDLRTGDPREAVQTLLRDLRARPDGLSSDEAGRRLARFGPNDLPHSRTPAWPRELARQVTHPLALLLWGAAGLAWVSGSGVLAGAIVGVVLLNAVLAFWQEQQAERSAEALSAYLPARARVLRDGHLVEIAAASLVPGDVMLLQEGAKIPADGRLLDGAVEVDMSALTGESVPVVRTAGVLDPTADLLHAPDAVFRGTACISGVARAMVFATGARTELGRIAGLTRVQRRSESPLEHQIRRVAWLIAAIAIGVGAAFLPLGLLAGLAPHEALIFAVGLLVANVPEGLLPTITLALAVGVRGLAAAGAVVKRLSAVETLGSTTVICTDKTGTLTQNRMAADRIWTPSGGERPVRALPVGTAPDLAALADALARCTEAGLDDDIGDPTELALLKLAAGLNGPGRDGLPPEQARRVVHRFDPRLRLMSTIQTVGGLPMVATKGAPEVVMPRCTRLMARTVPGGDGAIRLDAERRAEVDHAVEALAGRGLRVLAVARRRGNVPAIAWSDRAIAERDLELVGLVGLLDPPRPSVAPAVVRCHRAGIRIHVISGDAPLTVAAIARGVGIGDASTPVITGAQLGTMTDGELSAVLGTGHEVVFARTAPEDKLRIADLLARHGEVVAMTGDGVNDAPALRRADIGVAMGRSGTDVAREAATMVLTDDDFASIVRAVEAGRRVYDNVRKFILYIVAHTVPEVAPFLLFALSGGNVPLPLTVLQILAIDLGTETLPALALGREPAEPGVMDRRPRSRSEPVVTGRMLLRGWAVMGPVSAALCLLAFFAVLNRAGWSRGADVAAGSPLHGAYLQATTASFAAIVACQVGTAFACRTDRVSLISIGLLGNRLLLAGIGFELAFTAALVYLPPLQEIFGTAALDGWTVALLAPFPVLVWAVDEVFRWAGRRARPTP